MLLIGWVGHHSLGVIFSQRRPGGVSVILVGTLSDLVELTGGVFRMGSQDFYPDEGPVHDEHVGPFAIEQHPVTNAQFSEFVSETGYLTVAERPLDHALFPTFRPRSLTSALALPPHLDPFDLSNWRQWWRWSSVPTGGIIRP